MAVGAAKVQRVTLALVFLPTLGTGREHSIAENGEARGIHTEGKVRVVRPTPGVGIERQAQP